jgi:hypothetical protein
MGVSRLFLCEPSRRFMSTPPYAFKTRRLATQVTNVMTGLDYGGGGKGLL